MSILSLERSSSDDSVRLEITSTSTHELRTLLSFERPCQYRLVRYVRYFSYGGPPACVHLENSIATTQRVLTDQENKSTRWMPWRQEPMKDVGGCDKPGGDADQSLIPGFPNGETYAW